MKNRNWVCRIGWAAAMSMGSVIAAGCSFGMTTYDSFGRPTTFSIPLVWLLGLL
jgi:hypothetical protein